MLSLNKINNATDEDKQWHIDEWARLFKATTWEELKMIAKNNDVYSEAVDSIYYQNSDETIREMCEARREALFHEECMQKRLEEADFHEKYMQKQLDEKDTQLEELKAQLEEQSALIKELQAQINDYK